MTDGQECGILVKGQECDILFEYIMVKLVVMSEGEGQDRGKT